MCWMCSTYTIITTKHVNNIFTKSFVLTSNTFSIFVFVLFGFHNKQTNTSSKSTIEIIKKVLTENQDAVLLALIWTYFLPFSRVFIDNYEQVCLPGVYFSDESLTTSIKQKRNKK